MDETLKNKNNLLRNEENLTAKKIAPILELKV